MCRTIDISGTALEVILGVMIMIFDWFGMLFISSYLLVSFEYEFNFVSHQLFCHILAKL